MTAAARAVILAACWTVLAVPVRGANLEAPCPLDLRAVPLGQALSDLCSRLGVAHLVDPLVPSAALQTPVRIAAAHLTGEEALRWVARAGGLEAVFVEETLLVAVPERLGRVWRVAGSGFSPVAGQAAAERVRRACRQRADLAWTDTPVTRVARDVSAAFGIDLVVHPAVLADAPMISVQSAGTDLEGLIRVLEAQLGCVAGVFDGVIYARPAVRPAALSGDGGSGPVGGGLQADGAETDDPMERRVAVDRSVKDWRQLAERLGKSSGIPFVLTGAEDAPWPAPEACGSVREILEAGRLAGLWIWQSSGDGGQVLGRITLAVRPGSAVATRSAGPD